MDQQYNSSEQIEQEQPQQVYGLKFAEDYYELPQVPVYQKPVKARRVRPKRERTALPTAIWILLVVMAVVISTVVTAVALDQRWQKRFDILNLTMQDKNAALQAQIDLMTKENGGMAAPAAPGEWMTPGQVYEQNVDAVVAISAYGKNGTYQSMGSGFILSADGYVVSNYHVVEGTEKIEVLTVDSGSYEATLVGFDQTNDIALLKVDAQDLPFVAVGSSDQLRVGDQVAAIGNPLGDLTSTMTVGYVSAKDRIVTTDGSTINMIQTDAAINSGNSGGPLFNMNGEVVGITTAKFSGTSTSGVSIEGIGFAIPMDDVIGMIDDLRELGYIAGAYLGVMVMDVDPAAQAYGLPAGAFVDEVTPGYAAEAAGMLAQDIIVSLGGYDVTSVSELTRMLRKFEPGQTVSVTVYRAGREVQLRVTLDEKPRETVETEPQVQQPEQEYPMPGMDEFDEWYRQFMEDFFG